MYMFLDSFSFRLSMHSLNVDSFLSKLEVVVRCGAQSFEMKLDMEVSAKRKAHYVGQVGEECQCVLDCDGYFEHGWMCRLFCFAQVDDVMQLYISSGCGYAYCYGR
jgi:hypothetical protein